ncbi:MAG: tetratricopeptide repeat protein [Planctomycetia bacterium]
MRRAAVLAIAATLFVAAGLVWWRVAASREDDAAMLHDRWIHLADRVHELKARGRYAEALQTATLALEAAEAGYGPWHPAVAESLNELAQLKVTASMFDGVDAMFQRAIEIQSRATGPCTRSRMAKARRCSGSAAA